MKRELIVSKIPVTRCPRCKMISNKIQIPREYDNPFLLNFKRIKCAICGKIFTGEISSKNKEKRIFSKEFLESMKKQHEDWNILGKEKYGEKISY